MSWNGKYTNVVSDVTVYAVWIKKESVPDTSTYKKTDLEKGSAEVDDRTYSAVQKIPNEEIDVSYEVPKLKKVTSLSVKNTKTKNFQSVGKTE